MSDPAFTLLHIQKHEPAGPSCDVVGLGECSLDVVLAVPAVPRAGAKLAASCLSRQPGGKVATAVLALQRWGWRTRFVGAVGDDEEGRAALGTLEAAGVELHCRVQAGVPSRSAVILVTGDGERTIVEYQDVRLVLDGSPAEVVRGARVLHLDLTFPAAALGAVRAAREQAVVVSVDLDELPQGVEGLLELADIAVVSEAAGRGRGLCEASAILDYVTGCGTGLACVTRGAQGCVAAVGSQRWAVPALRVPAVDTTGCGDVFRAGLLHALLKGWNAERALHLATVAGGLQATKLGAQAAIPALKDIERALPDV